MINTKAIKASFKRERFYFLFILLSIIPLILILLSLYVSDYIYWISIPISIFYIIVFSLGFFNFYEDYKYYKKKEEYLPDGVHTIESYSGYTILNKLNGKIHGSYEKFYRDGNIELKTNYTNGEIHGSYEKFYRDGNIGLKTNYTNGKIDGSNEEFHKNGEIKFKTYYSNGIQNGETTTYDEDGNLLRKSFLKDGDYSGEVIEYYKSGNIRMKNNGKCYTFYSKGEIKTCEINLIIKMIRDTKRPGTSIIKPIGLWTNYKDDGYNFDYQLNFENFDEASNKVEKIVYENDGNTTKSIINFEFDEFSDVHFLPKFAYERLSNNIIRYNNGLKGPPGISRINTLEIKPIISLEDFYRNS